MFGIKHAGIGRYVQNLVEELLSVDKINEYVLFFNYSSQSEVQISNLRNQNKNLKLKIVMADIPHYSLKEQILFPGIINKEHLDLMHFPHFNIPIFYHRKFVVTIHDLIKHFSKGKATTTKNELLYWLKYFGYKLVFNNAVRKAEKIIVPSFFVKDQLLKEYSIDVNKIAVTYEAADDKFKMHSEKIKVDDNAILEKYKIRKPYLLYLGSVYPHKNIERLIEAIKILNIEKNVDIKLVVSCARNVFWERLKEKINLLQAEDFVILAGFVSDEDLIYLFKYSKAFVFPTLSEGFGLPGLEAMMVSCPVICSDIPVLREIYKDGAYYFNPENVSDIANKINTFLKDDKLGKKLAARGNEIVKEYSWKKTAKATLEIYEKLLQ